MKRSGMIKAAALTMAVGTAAYLAIYREPMPKGTKALKKAAGKVGQAAGTLMESMLH